MTVLRVSDEECQGVVQADRRGRALPRRVQQAIDSVGSGERHVLLVRNLPVPDGLPPTPEAIRADVQPRVIHDVSIEIADRLGSVAEHSPENTIRFKREEAGVAAESWHGHPHHDYSVFYCVRGDPEATTYVTSTEDVLDAASEARRDALLKAYSYGEERFSLLQRQDDLVVFAPQLYVASDLQRDIEDLHLPDVKRGLERLICDELPSEARGNIAFLTEFLDDVDRKVCYEAGDLAVFNERTTLRYSPGYEETGEEGERRWLYVTGVD